VSPPRVLAVIPTYNERENIEPLVRALFGLGIPGFGALVVDDESPDGTSAAVEKLVPEFPGLELLRRRGPAGRGLAGRDGFVRALEKGARYIIEMDGDFSHQPKDVPRLLAAMDRCDVAVGSRLAAGGADKDRPAWRRIVTRWANLYARLMLGLPVRDANSGFRCFNREAMEAIDPATLKSRGPSIVHEALYRCVRKGLRIEEVPIDFIDRKKGKSKLNLRRLAAGYFWILRLRLGI